jgi:cAMP-dependent protein kinase regulator
MSSTSDFQNEISALTREIEKQQPSDVLQFCANHFNRRLESQRAEHHISHNTAAGKGAMNESAFPGTNPFGASSASDGPRGMNRVIEEDEHEGPTASPSDDAAPFSNNANPFGGSSGNPNPFGGSSNSGAPQASSSAFGTSSFGQSTFGAAGSFSGQRMAPISGNNLPTNYNFNRRVSVSAESMDPNANPDSNWSPPVHQKTPEQLARLRKAIANNFIFSHLDEQQTSQVLGALVEKTIPTRGIKVISQGDVGDYFYVVEKGVFEVYVSSSGKLEGGADGMGSKVNTMKEGSSFGELALMYNAPRAATVVSTEPSTLWALDRVTFRRILMDSAMKRRQMYERFLAEVTLLSGLTEYERSKIADALNTQKFAPGQKIIEEGDVGEDFFILEYGEAEVYKRGNQQPVHKYKKGDYFGELALLNDAPRAASIVATTDVKVAALGKEGFQRLLGPVETLMRRNDPSRKNPFGDDVDPLAAAPA